MNLACQSVADAGPRRRDARPDRRNGVGNLDSPGRVGSATHGAATYDDDSLVDGSNSEDVLSGGAGDDVLDDVRGGGSR